MHKMSVYKHSVSLMTHGGGGVNGDGEQGRDGFKSGAGQSCDRVGHVTGSEWTNEIIQGKEPRDQLCCYLSKSQTNTVYCLH